MSLGEPYFITKEKLASLLGGQLCWAPILGELSFASLWALLTSINGRSASWASLAGKAQRFHANTLAGIALGNRNPDPNIRPLGDSVDGGRVGEIKPSVTNWFIISPGNQWKDPCQNQNEICQLHDYSERTISSIQKPVSHIR